MVIHKPVMVEEAMELLDLSGYPEGTYIDATVGTGGHSREICRRLGPKGKLVGLDKDEESLNFAANRLSEWKDKFSFFQVNFSRLDELIRQENISNIRGILYDLGFSSFQLESSHRGFSFQRDEPLDMRMDERDDITAEKIVNSYSKEKLVKILREYGEERFARRIANAIVKKKKKEPLERTSELEKLVNNAIPSSYGKRRRINPATKTFQALRIEVNDELENLRKGLEGGFNFLEVGGRMVVISYHSLEDRIVKHFIKEKEKDCVCPPDFPVCVCDKRKEAEILTDGPMKPTEEEIQNNRRSRSALLRAICKV